MLVRVALALGGTGAAGRLTCLQGGQLCVAVGLSLAAQDAPRIDAGVGAVEAKPDAANHLANIVLGSAGIGADRADRGALGALVDACRKHADIGYERERMGPQDLCDAHAPPLVRTGRVRTRTCAGKRMRRPTRFGAGPGRAA